MNSPARNIFTFSPSVVQFHTQPHVRSAVELLVDEGFVFSPDGKDDWDRVATYYDACLAAQQTKIEFAKDMCRLWAEIWQVPDSWQPVPARAADEELSLNPDVRWGENSFERDFRYGHDLTAALWTVFDEDSVKIGFTIQRNSRTLRKKLKASVPNYLKGWEFSEDAFRFDVGNVYLQGVDLVPLRHEARAAIEFIENFEP